MENVSSKVCKKSGNKVLAKIENPFKEERLLRFDCKNGKADNKDKFSEPRYTAGFF